jgi:anti-repressor protein
MNLPSIKPQQIGDELIQTVDGRELYAFLDIKKTSYTEWVKKQVSRAELESGRDFIKTPAGVKGRGRPRHEYFFTLKAGKHIGMISQTERGIQVREYFIECERRLLAVEKAPAVQLNLRDSNLLSAIILQLNEIKEEQSETIEKQSVVIVKQETLIRDMAPKVEGFERLAETEGDLCISDAAKLLQMRPKDLTDRLILRKWCFRRSPGGRLVISEPVRLKGFMVMKPGPKGPDGKPKWEQARLTYCGLMHIAERLGVAAVQLTLPRLN